MRAEKTELTAIPTACVGVRHDGQIRECNRLFLDLIGHVGRDLHGVDLEGLLLRSHREPWGRFLQRLAEQPESTDSLCVAFTSPDGPLDLLLEGRAGRDGILLLARPLLPQAIETARLMAAATTQESAAQQLLLRRDEEDEQFQVATECPVTPDDGVALAEALKALASLVGDRHRGPVEPDFAQLDIYRTRLVEHTGPGQYRLVDWRLFPLDLGPGRTTFWLAVRIPRCSENLSGPPTANTLGVDGRADLGSHTGIWSWDLVTNRIGFSQRLIDELGVNPDEAEDLVAFNASLFHPDDLPLMDRAVRGAVEEGDSYELVARLKGADGRYRSILVRGQPICDENGTTVQLIGTETDISEQLALDDKLLRAERIAKLGNWSRRLGRDDMYWSPELFRIHGLDPDVHSPSLADLSRRFHPEDVPLIQAGEARVLRRWKLDPDVVDRVRVRLLRPDGSTRHCEISTTVETDGEGAPCGLVGTVQDISELVAAEQRLLRAQKMEVIGQLAGGAAHDFNNLLAVIMGNLELLGEEAGSERGSALLQSALDASVKGSELTRNLLSFARQAVLSPRRLNLSDVLVDMRAVLERVLPSSIQLNLKAEPDLWSVHADRSSFENAVLNLAINARDAMPDGGMITIETENRTLTESYSEERQETLSPGPFVVFALTDTGTGIAQADLQDIFTPYFSTKPTEQGSGLGLSMVHGFARQSGGGVRLYSEPGVGTTVKLFFPASTLDASMDIGEVQPQAPLEVAGNVLLVDDNAGVRDILECHLRGFGLTSFLAGDGAEAEKVHTELGRVDLLITDVVIPGPLQGPDIARILRKRQPDLKVIFITGYPNEAAIHGNGLRPEDVRLMKPISKADLAQAVGSLLKD